MKVDVFNKNIVMQLNYFITLYKFYKICFKSQPFNVIQYY